MTTSSRPQPFAGMVQATGSKLTTMATLPGMPQNDEPEPDALPVEPDDGTSLPVLPGSPGHEPVEHPKT